MKNNKVNEIFYRVSIKQSYQDRLRELREKYYIPSKGFDNERDKLDWEKKLNKKEYFKDILSLNKYHKLSIMYYDHLEHLLIYNKYLEKGNLENQLCYSYISNDEGVNRIHIVVHPYAKPSDIKKYVDEQKKDLDNKFNLIRGSFSKTVQPSLYKERDESIYKMSLKKKKDLHDLVENGHKKYKESIIKELIRNKFGSNLSEETIKSIIKKQKDLRKG